MVSWLPRISLRGHCIAEDDGEFEGTELCLRWGKLQVLVVVAWRSRQL